MRLPLPACYIDPASHHCLNECIETPELIENFDRLYGATLAARKSPIETMVDVATGKRDDDMRAFIEFVHDSVYLRLSDAALESLRASA